MAATISIAMDILKFETCLFNFVDVKNARQKSCTDILVVHKVCLGGRVSIHCPASNSSRDM